MALVGIRKTHAVLPPVIGGGLRENIMDSPLNPYIADLAQKNAALYQKLETYEQLLETHGGTIS